MSAIRGLEALVNLARLQIRAGRADAGRQRLLDLHEAVGVGSAASFEGIDVPADLTSTAEDRREVHAWLWRVLLADGTRALTTTGRWTTALAHIEGHRGVGRRMLDGRQVAVVAASAANQTAHAAELLSDTVPGEPWEHAVTACLTALCHRAAGMRIDDVADLVTMYLDHEAKPGMTVFDIRLGLTTPNLVETAEHLGARRLVVDLIRRIAAARDGYAAREVLACPLFIALAMNAEAQDCEDLVRACALGSGALPEQLYLKLSAALDSSEVAIVRSLTATGR